MDLCVYLGISFGSPEEIFVLRKFRKKDYEIKENLIFNYCGCNGGSAHAGVSVRKLHR